MKCNNEVFVTTLLPQKWIDFAFLGSKLTGATPNLLQDDGPNQPIPKMRGYRQILVFISYHRFHDKLIRKRALKRRKTHAYLKSQSTFQITISVCFLCCLIWELKLLSGQQSSFRGVNALSTRFFTSTNLDLGLQFDCNAEKLFHDFFSFSSTHWSHWTLHRGGLLLLGSLRNYFQRR